MLKLERREINAVYKIAITNGIDVYVVDRCQDIVWDFISLFTPRTHWSLYYAIQNTMGKP